MQVLGENEEKLAHLVNLSGVGPKMADLGSFFTIKMGPSIEEDNQ